VADQLRAEGVGAGARPAGPPQGCGRALVPAAARAACPLDLPATGWALARLGVPGYRQGKPHRKYVIRRTRAEAAAEIRRLLEAQRRAKPPSVWHGRSGKTRTRIRPMSMGTANDGRCCSRCCLGARKRLYRTATCRLARANTGVPPGTRTPNPRIKRELLGRTTRSTCANVPGICPEHTQRTGVRSVLVPRPVPRHPGLARGGFGHRA
jgi:hypothetical protein